MLCDIFILIFLCRQIATRASAKGRSGFAWGFLMFVVWFGCLFGGAFIFGILSAVLADGSEPNLLLAVGCAYGLAIAGAVAMFSIVNNLHDVRDDYQLRERDRSPDDRPWSAEDYRKHFGLGGSQPGNLPYERRPENEDDRYRTE